MLKANRTEYGYIINYSDHVYEVENSPKGWIVRHTDNENYKPAPFKKLKNLKNDIAESLLVFEEKVEEKPKRLGLWDTPPLSAMLTLAYENRQDIPEIVLTTLDSYAMLLPDGGLNIQKAQKDIEIFKKCQKESQSIVDYVL
jgi:hypothetical protein